VLGLLLACGGPDLESRALDRAITIDGRSDEWRDALVAVKDTGVALAAFNDKDNLYLCITSSNPDISLRALDQGMTVWFTPHGGDGARLGLEYPLLQDRLAPERPGGAAADNPLLAGLENVPRVGLLGPGPRDRRVVAVTDVPGLAVSVAAVNGGLVYELKLPLARESGRPLAVGAGAGGAVDLDLETSNIPSLPQSRADQARPRGGGAGGRGGGMGGRGGGGRGGMGGGMGGGRGRGTGRSGGASPAAGADDGAAKTKIPPPLKLSLRLRLAS